MSLEQNDNWVEDIGSRIETAIDNKEFEKAEKLAQELKEYNEETWLSFWEHLENSQRSAYLGWYDSKEE
jgi:hypothetical protein